MLTRISKKTWWGLAMITTTLLILAGSVWTKESPTVVAQVTPPEEGVICTEDAGSNPTFTLNTQTGYVGTPDDNVIFMWGLSEGTNQFQHPGPILCINEGDTVTIILHNSLPEDISMMFPGQDNVLANGQPAQPQFDNLGNLTSLTNVAPANGGSVTYSFVANHPGSFVYESGTNPAIQVRMGLFGGMIVRPALGPNYVNNRLDSEFNPDEEYMVLFSEIDPYLNQAVERGDTFDLNLYKPRYWLLNGRGFPDTIAPNFASWLPSQPYGALARVHPYDAGSNPLYAVEHFLNVGSDIVPMHPHGKNALIVSRDGRSMAGAGGEDLAQEHFSIPVGPGQTYDGLFRWVNQEQYDPITNPVPVTIPNLQNLNVGLLYSGSPYLGDQDTVPVGTTTLNQCGEYYIISHNHALFKITSWGVPATGPITFMRIDPPLPNNCPS